MTVEKKIIHLDNEELDIVMKNPISQRFFIIVTAVCFLLVTFVYIFNHNPLGSFMNRPHMPPQQLCQLLYEERLKPAEAFTYDRQPDGKYVIYRLNFNDGTYQRSIEDLPVDVDGFQWHSKNKGKVDITVTKTGFEVPSLGAHFNCPPRYSWNSEQGECIEDPVCLAYDNSITPLLNTHYTEFKNPAITMHTPLTNNLVHKKLYVECSKAEKKAVVKSCSEHTFVKISKEPYDEGKLYVIPPLENGEANVNAICKTFDVCEYREDNSVHRFPINESDEPLKEDEYYICKTHKSEKEKCAPNHKVNPDMEHTASHICIPINHCDTNHNFYFRINSDSFSYCRNHIEYMVSCDGNGIFYKPDRSIECRNEKCLELEETFSFNNNIFNYPYGIESCFDGNSPKKISCDEMFKELQPVSKITNISLPRTKINRQSDSREKSKEYFEDHEIVLPTKFYYDEVTKKCEPFKSTNIKQFLIDMKMIKDDAVIYKSTSYGMKSLPFRIKDDVIMLDSNKLGFSKPPKVYAIFNGKIYCTGTTNEGVLWNDQSKDFYSFISPIDVEPKPIDNNILDSKYDEIDGVYYGLCMKYHKTLTLVDDTNNVLHVSRQSLTEFQNNVTKEVISSSVEKYQIDYDSLIKKGILSENFPKDQFSWNKLFVGKYFYDETKKHFVIWHDHLFVISLVNPNLIVNHSTDENGQFIVNNFPSGIISDIYRDDNGKVSTWDETSLVTTFNYFKEYFNFPVPFWMSFIRMPVTKLTEDNVLNYLRIDYPLLKTDSIRKTLMSIIKIEPLQLNI